MWVVQVWALRDWAGIPSSLSFLPRPAVRPRGERGAMWLSLDGLPLDYFSLGAFSQNF